MKHLPRHGGVVFCGALLLFLAWALEAQPADETVCSTLAPLASGICEVQGGGAEILIRGTVLAPGHIYRGGSVLVDAQGFIACVGCGCSSPGATLVTCPKGVISPGLINTHEHSCLPCGGSE